MSHIYGRLKQAWDNHSMKYLSKYRNYDLEKHERMRIKFINSKDTEPDKAGVAEFIKKELRI